MTNKLKYFIGNWKMFGDFNDFKIVNKINKFTQKSKNILKKKKVILCLPNILIYDFNKKLKSKFLSLGAQNCHPHDKYGPYTGSVSSFMLKKAGAKYVILGHSENRSEGDSNILIREKIVSALKQKLNVIFCIGETLKEKKLNKTNFVLNQQIKHSLSKKINFNKIIIAYEPVWSIGTNKIPNISELKVIIKFIKNKLKKNSKNKKSHL